MLIIFWIPTTIIFLVDAQILFALVQMVAGLAVGWRHQVGNIHDWPTLLLRFDRIRECIGEKLSVKGTEEWQKQNSLRQKDQRKADMRKTFVTRQDSLQAPLVHGVGGL